MPLHSGHNPWADISVLKRYEFVKVGSRSALLFGGLGTSLLTGNLQTGRALNAHVAINADDAIWRWSVAQSQSDSWIAYRHRSDALGLVYPAGAWQKWQDSKFRQPSEDVPAGAALALTDDDPGALKQTLDAAAAPVGAGAVQGGDIAAGGVATASKVALEAALKKSEGSSFKCSDGGDARQALTQIVGQDAASRDFQGVLTDQKYFCHDGASIQDADANAVVVLGADDRMFSAQSTRVDEADVTRMQAAGADATVGREFHGMPGAPVPLPADAERKPD